MAKVWWESHRIWLMLLIFYLQQREIHTCVQLLFSMLSSLSKSLPQMEFCPPSSFILCQWSPPGFSLIVLSPSTVTYFMVYSLLDWNFKPSHSSFPSKSFLLPVLRFSSHMVELDESSEEWLWNHLKTILSLSSLYLTDHCIIWNLNIIRNLMTWAECNCILC